MDLETLDATLDYESPVPLFASGAEAAEHGRREIEAPPEEADRVILKIVQRRARRGVTE